MYNFLSCLFFYTLLERTKEYQLLIYVQTDLTG